MPLPMELGRKLTELRFRIFGLAIIQDIPSEQFHSIIKVLRKQGWEKIYEYKGFDSWIDYGKVVLIKGNVKLKFEWDNWCEGEISGPSSEVFVIARSNNLNARTSPKWIKV